LASLPHLPELVLAGGIRPIALYFARGQDIVQQKLCLWMEPGTSVVRSVVLSNPADGEEDGAIAAALDAFVIACTAPAMQPPAVPTDASTATGGKQGHAKASCGVPGLPAKVLINDVALAEAARVALAPLDITVEYRPEVPAFDRLFEAMALELGADPTAPPPQPFTWEIDAALQVPLYKAAAGFLGPAPVDTLWDHPPIAVALGEHGPEPEVETLYASVLGARREVFGVALYYSAEDFRLAAEEGARLPELPADTDLTEFAELLRQAGAPLDHIPPALRDQVVRELFSRLGRSASVEVPIARQNGIAVLFEDSSEADPTYYGWIKTHKLPVASREALPLFLRTSRKGEPRQPQEHEVRAVTLALDALNRFFSKASRLLETITPDRLPVTQTVQVTSSAEPSSVRLTFPAPGFALDEKRSAIFNRQGSAGETQRTVHPVTEEARTTLYRVKVELKEGPVAQVRDVWRCLELQGDQTLHDL